MGNGVILNKVSYLPFLTLLSILISCEKHENKEEDLAIGNKTSIVINVSGIADVNNVYNTKLATQSGTDNSNKREVGEIISHSAGFDTRVSAGDFEASTNNTNIYVKNRLSGKLDAVRAAKMEDGIYYHLLLFKDSDNTIAYNGQLESGSTFTINVDAGILYRWVAFSYNTTISSELPAVSNLSNAIVPMGENKDFLYATGSITPTALVNTPLGIFFRHMTARIAVELDTRGMFAPIDTATVSIDSQLRTGNFDLMEGELTGSFSTISNATSSSFKRVDGYNYDDRKVTYFYTADPSILSSLRVNLKSLSINLDTYAVSQGQGKRVFTGLTSSFSVENFMPVLEKSKLFKIDLIESPVTTTSNGGSIVTRWARANLYYAGSSDHNPYRFHHLNQQTQDLNTFFSARAVVPQLYATSGAEGDPCLKVYPENIWRQATKVDYQGLVGRSILDGGIIFAKSPTREVGKYLEYDATGTISPYPGNKLRFNLNGSAIGLNLVQGLIQLDLGSIGQTVAIWTSTPLLDLGSIGSVGQWHFDGTNTSIDVSAAVLDISLLPGLGGGLDVVKSGFMNIRCVRN